MTDEADREAAESWCRLAYGRCHCSEDGRIMCRLPLLEVERLHEYLSCMRSAMRMPGRGAAEEAQ